MNTQDMDKEQRKQFVEELERSRKEAIKRVPLLTPEQLRACACPDDHEVAQSLAKAEREHQDRYRRWIEEGGSLENFK